LSIATFARHKYSAKPVKKVRPLTGRKISMLELLESWLSGHCVNEYLTFYTARATIFMAVLVLAAIANCAAKRYICLC
jgi:hypothetical protein